MQQKKRSSKKKKKENFKNFIQFQKLQKKFIIFFLYFKKYLIEKKTTCNKYTIKIEFNHFINANTLVHNRIECGVFIEGKKN